VYAAAIPLGLPVRDVEQDAKGDIIVWTDHDIVTLAPARVMLRGELRAAECLACHTLFPDRTEHGIGPNLVGIIGRRVASAAGFPYSEALRNLGGSWDRARLDAFLADPTHVAPGNQMRFGGIASSTERADIISFLETRAR
jgi:cytochrome c